MGDTSRDEEVQNETLPSQPELQVWKEFFEFVRGIEIPEDWMKDRPMNRIPTEDRTLFSEDD